MNALRKKKINKNNRRREKSVAGHKDRPRETFPKL